MKGLKVSKTGSWSFRKRVPPELVSVIGKREFQKSFGKINKAEALLKASRYLADCEEQIARARGVLIPSDFGPLDSETRQEFFEHLAASVLLEFRNSPQKLFYGSEKGALELLEQNKLNSFDQTSNHLFGSTPYKSADDYKAALGYCQPVKYLDSYESTLDRLQPRSRDEHTSLIRKYFLSHFETISPATFDKQAVLNWQKGLSHLSNSSQRKVVSHCANFVDYLIDNELTTVTNHIRSLKLPKKSSKAKSDRTTKRQPFEVGELVRLHSAIKDKKPADRELEKLFLIGVYTGMRIEEICRIKFSDVKRHKQRYYLTVYEDAKTAAGAGREIPIHRNIERLFTVREKTDDFVIHVRCRNQYEERSSAIGKRFGRLKKDLGFGIDKVFHSIRKTFITELERAGVTEAVTASIVGHEYRTMTYGLYSGGVTINTKFEYMDMLDFGGICIRGV
ncbi:tyrosine-type recombinase/integrase [Nitrincola alkalilacustris]|uniref:tyrosine-type recombinase/integrase n=1 Tax=Nitrincola alkalilacustris TaxID=1571224 RepID=UPI00145659DF|nr:tyrosine-type recombinase/integrase [Nitrincola alkalilacustris]